MDDRGHLTTELRHAGSLQFDRLSIADAFDLMNGEDARVASAIADARTPICRAIELVVRAFKGGGRLIYVGAGTSGRLGVLDATECPPTFLSPPTQVVGVIAGGHEALVRSIEGAEDDPNGGASAIEQLGVSQRDVVFGIATGGTTPYVHGAIRQGRRAGAGTVFFACVPEEQVPDEADVSIRVMTGPEVLTGSTRLKAGTATKMVLNMVTTIAMARCGKVYQNLMVDVNTGANRKLVDRGERILMTLTGLPRAACASLLGRAGGQVKVALVMHAAGVDELEARARLDRAAGMVGAVLPADGDMKHSDENDRDDMASAGGAGHPDAGKESMAG